MSYCFAIFCFYSTVNKEYLTFDVAAIGNQII